MALMAYGPDATAHQVPVSDGASGWTMQKVTSAEIDAAAAITYSQLSLSAGDIALSKLADPGSGKVVGSVGSGAVAVVPPGTQLDAASITATTASITATTEGTSVAVITGHSITYAGTQVLVEFFCPSLSSQTGAATVTFVFYVDSTVIGQSTRYDSNNPFPVFLKTYHTPSAGAHTYKIAVFVSTNGVTINADVGGSGKLLPAFLRVVSV